MLGRVSAFHAFNCFRKTEDQDMGLDNPLPMPKSYLVNTFRMLEIGLELINTP